MRRGIIQEGEPNRTPREKVVYKGPRTYLEQPEVVALLKKQYKEAEWEDRLDYFYHSITSILQENGIDFKDSVRRVKPLASMKARLRDRRAAGQTMPFYDIYGVKLIFKNPKIMMTAVDRILKVWNMPQKTSWGADAVKKFDQFRTSIHSYQAIHMRLPFSIPGLPGEHIGEVQLVTRKQDAVNQKMREAYEYRTGKIYSKREDVSEEESTDNE